MKVLMFGWEYPPHVFGGLATANFGISEGLHAQGDVEITLCLPRPFGDEDHTYARIVAMNCVPIVYKNVDRDYVKQRIGNLMDPDEYYRFRDHIYADFGYMHVNDLGCMEFAGGYPSNLNEEINNYSIIAGQVRAPRSSTSFTLTTGSPTPPASSPSKSAESHCAYTSTPPTGTARADTSTLPSTA